MTESLHIDRKRMDMALAGPRYSVPDGLNEAQIVAFIDAVAKAAADGAKGERERIVARAHSRYEHEVRAAVHHSGRWYAAFEWHLTRQAAMADMLEVIRQA